MSKKLVGQEHNKTSAIIKLIKKGVIFREDLLWEGSLTMNIHTDRVEMGIRSWGLVDYLCGKHGYYYMIER